MKSFYYNVDDAEFVDSSGEKLSRFVPELFYQEHAEWRIFLRDGENRSRSLAGIVAWGAAVDCDYRCETAPMCRSLAGDIVADAEAGSVTVKLDAATAEFFAAVNGTPKRKAFFALYGLNRNGERELQLEFEISARMIIDPDPALSPEVPETLATKEYVTARIGSAVALAYSGAFAGMSGAMYYGGFMKAPVAVTSGGSVAYIPALSGGMCYRFTEPLVALSVGSVADVPVEDTVIFSAGGVEVPPTSMSVYFESGYFDEENWGWATGSKELSLLGSGGVLSCAPSGSEWATKWIDEPTGEKIYLSGGSVVALCSGAVWTVSAHDLGFYVRSGFLPGGEDDEEASIVSSGTISGLVASSVDNGKTWTFGGVTIPWIAGDDMIYGTRDGDGSACKVDHDGETIPCAVTIPSGAVLIGSSKVEVEFGHSYEMNVANGGIVIAERCAQEAEE